MYWILWVPCLTKEWNTLPKSGMVTIVYIPFYISINKYLTLMKLMYGIFNLQTLKIKKPK